jgi:hypothetical protein
MRPSMFALIVLLSACQLPAMKFQAGAGDVGRDNLARFFTNRATAAFYQGHDEAVEEALNFALELAPELDEAVIFKKRRFDLRYKPGYLYYSDYPAKPEPREIPGATIRAIFYPIWGLPFDLVELPLKGLLAVPILGAAVYPATFLFYPYPRKAPPDGERGSNIRVGVGLGATTSLGARGRFGVGGSPVLYFFVINGLPAIVYQANWPDRFEAWGRCGTWWWPWAADKLHVHDFYPDRGVGSAFFVNARRITVKDQALDEALKDLGTFRKRSIDQHNIGLEEFNRRILSLPRDIGRSEVQQRLGRYR